MNVLSFVQWDIDGKGDQARASLQIEAGSDRRTLLYFTPEELRQFVMDSHFAYQRLVWLHATWMYAERQTSTRIHLVRKGAHHPYGHALCGVQPEPRSDGWWFRPLHGDPHDAVCQSCLRRWRQLKEGASAL